MSNLTLQKNLINHFDFTKSRTVLLLGPMGSGKTEYCAKIFNDSTLIYRKKNKKYFEYNGYNKMEVMYFKNISDLSRFKNHPQNSISYRSGYTQTDCVYVVKNIQDIKNILQNNHTTGTIILDEPCFYDSSIVDLLMKEKEKRNGILVLTSLGYNFKRKFFNSTAEKISKISDQTINFSGYCSHADCTQNSYYSYRYYNFKNQEIPAPYFDPLIIVGGTNDNASCIYPNYSLRCSKHHYVSGQEYCKEVVNFDKNQTEKELFDVKNNIQNSFLYKNYHKNYKEEILLSTLKLNYLSERILIYLFEKNVLNKQDILYFFKKLDFSFEYFNLVKKGLVN